MKSAVKNIYTCTSVRMYYIFWQDVIQCYCILTDGSYGNAESVGSDREGVVQVEFYGRWGHICDTSWDSVDAEVACVEFNKDNSVSGYDTNPEGE